MIVCNNIMLPATGPITTNTVATIPTPFFAPGYVYLIEQHCIETLHGPNIKTQQRLHRNQ
jgi:hypothetical protein